MAAEMGTAEPNRRFVVIPIVEEADLLELIAQHPNAWLLDSTTGVMTSLAGWKAAPSARKATAA